jgi:hypothetical protein
MTMPKRIEELVVLEDIAVKVVRNAPDMSFVINSQRFFLSPDIAERFAISLEKAARRIRKSQGKL